MFLAWVLLLLAAGYYFFRPQSGISVRRASAAGAETILKQRYVSGEIDEETYRRMLEAIRS